MAAVLSKIEKETLICGVCGKPAKSERGLKIHKSRVCNVEPVKEEIKEEIKEEPKEEIKEVVKEVPTEAPIVASLDEMLKQPSIVEEDPIKALSAADLGLTTIPVGAIVALTGFFWKKDPVTNVFADSPADELKCRVMQKFNQNGFDYLQLNEVESDGEWSCLDQDVLSGKITLVSLKDPTPVPLQSEDAIAPQAADIAVRDNYLKICEEYVLARDGKKEATSNYDDVNKIARPVILSHIDKYGSESVYGKKDNKLIDGGFDVHYTFDAGKIAITRDDEAIIKWLLENKMTWAIKESLDVEKWTEMVEAGQVPKEFIKKVHTETKLKDKRRLLINRVDS